MLLDLLDELDVDLQHVGNGLGGSKGEPLREGDIGDAVALVEFKPHELFGVGGVLDVGAYGI